jgi:hypothetical protein
MNGKIFINYRRGDEPGFTQALFSRLEQAFSADRLFMDVDNISPGEDFVLVLESQVAQCDALLAVIGKGWLDAKDERGNRRLDDPKDFVRIEIESALKRGKRVIPVLMPEARMPRPDDLPEAVRPLARYQAVRLTHERFRSDTRALVGVLQRMFEEVAAQNSIDAETARRDKAAKDSERQKAAARQREEEARARREQEQLLRQVYDDRPRTKSGIDAEAQARSGVIHLNPEANQRAAAKAPHAKESDPNRKQATRAQEGRGQSRRYSNLISSKTAAGIGVLGLVTGLALIGLGVPIKEFSFGLTLINSGVTAAVSGAVLIGVASPRAFFRCAIGFIGCAAGLALIGFGIPIKEFSFGNSLINSGVIAVAGGAVLTGLASSRQTVHYTIGFIGCAAGLVLIGFGIPVKEFSIGDTLINSGVTAMAGGAALIGLASPGVIRYAIGFGGCVTGLVLIGFGIPVKEFSFGNTLITSGGTAMAVGAVLIALVFPRPVIHYVVGFFGCAVGLALIGSGIPVKEFSFGKTLLSSGVTALVGGAILFGLASVLRTANSFTTTPDHR